MQSDAEQKIREYNIRQEERVQEFAKSLMNRMPLFIAIGIAIFWVFYGTIEIYPTTLSITDRIVVTICTVALAVSYCDLIALGGFRSAKESKDYKDADEKYDKALKRGNTKKAEITEYAKDVAKENLKDWRKNNLEANGLKYEDYFDSNLEYIGGDYNRDKSLRRSQKKCIRKCINQRIILPDIFGFISSKVFGIKKPITEKQYLRKTSVYNTIIRIAISIASVGVMFNFLGFSIGSMIYALFQIVMWTASGFSQRIKNFNFIKDNIIPQIKEKTLIIDGYMDLSEEKKKEYEVKINPVIAENEVEKDGNNE